MSTITATKPSLTLKRRYNAAPAKVYAAWTDPEKLKRWMGPGEVGQGELSVGAPGASAPAEQKRSEGAEVPADRRYLRLVTLLVGVATMTLLCIDYVFKASAARALPSADLGAFFARYYAVLNLVAFAFQLVLATLAER